MWSNGYYQYNFPVQWKSISFGIYNLQCVLLSLHPRHFIHQINIRKMGKWPLLHYHCIQDISYIMSTSEKQGNNHCYQKTSRCQLQPLKYFTGNRYTFLWVACIYPSSYFVVVNKRDLIQTMNINIFLIHRCLLSLQVFIQPF